MSDLDPALPPPTHTHPGVSPDSWTQFEQRVRARRFDALVRTAQGALNSGNLALAQHALNEAREIEEHAPAVARLSAEIQSRSGARPGEFVRRAATAFGLLALGIGMVVGLDIWQVSRPTRTPAPLADATANAVTTQVALEGQRMSAAAQVPFMAGVRDRRPISTNPNTMLPASTAWPGENQARPAAVQGSRPAASARSTILSSSPNEERASIAPMTVAVTPVSPVVAELDANVPGASVATLLSDAAAQVAESSEPSDAATELRKVAALLQGYARAYAALDITATRRLWPNASERELSRAFETMLSRYVSFDACDINVEGATATASCRGQARYTEKPDVPTTSTGARTWRFDLRRDGETWKIENAESTR